MKCKINGVWYKIGLHGNIYAKDEFGDWYTCTFPKHEFYKHYELQKDKK